MAHAKVNLEIKRKENLEKKKNWGTINSDVKIEVN